MSESAKFRAAVLSTMPLESETAMNKNDIIRIESDKRIRIVLKTLISANAPLHFEEIKKLTGLNEKAVSNSLVFLRDRYIVSKDEANRTYKISKNLPNSYIKNLRWS